MNKFILSLIASAFMASAVYSFEEPQFRGFISQGYIISKDNPIYGIDDHDSIDFREVGLNVSWQAADRLRLSGQVLSRRLGEYQDGSPVLDFLLLDYNFYLQASNSAGIRLGRVKTPYGIYNTTRDVPHARPGVFVPQSVYFESFRDAFISMDGLNLYYNGNFDFGDVGLDVYAGQTTIDTNGIEYQLFESDVPGSFRDAALWGGRVSVSPNILPGLTLTASVLDVDVDLDARSISDYSQQELGAAGFDLFMNPMSFPNYLTSLSIDARLAMLSAQYTFKNFMVTTEVLDIASDTTNMSILGAPPLPNSPATSSAYYLQLEWQAMNSLSLYTRAERLYYNDDDKDGQIYAQSLGLNASNRFTESLTVGARWHFNSDLSLTAEYSDNQGGAFLIGPDAIDYSQTQEHWDMFITTLSYHF